MPPNPAKIVIIGLGYVGLPLAVEFGKTRPVVGFDINADRIQALQRGHDSTLEVSDDELGSADQLTFTTDPAALQDRGGPAFLDSQTRSISEPHPIG